MKEFYKPLVFSLFLSSLLFPAVPGLAQVSIEELLKQVQALQAQLAAMQNSSSPSAPAPSATPSFTRDLKLGSTGEDVRALQKFLNGHGYKVVQTGAGSPGNESTYFGVRTKDALVKWQLAMGISPASGYFGRLSRAALEKTLGTPPPSTLPIAPAVTADLQADFSNGPVTVTDKDVYLSWTSTGSASCLLDGGTVPPNGSTTYSNLATGTKVYALSCGGAADNVTVNVQALTESQPPSVPAGLSASAISVYQINLSWGASTDNVGVAGYKVYRNGIQIATVAGNLYQDSGAAPKTTYSYTVSAYDAVGNNSAQSASATLTTGQGSAVIVSATSTLDTPAATTTQKQAALNILKFRLANDSADAVLEGMSSLVTIHSFGVKALGTPDCPNTRMRILDSNGNPSQWVALSAACEAKIIYPGGGNGMLEFGLTATYSLEIDTSSWGAGVVRTVSGSLLSSEVKTQYGIPLYVYGLPITGNQFTVQ